MKHVKLFEGFLNETRDVKVNQKFGVWQVHNYRPKSKDGKVDDTMVLLVNTESQERVYIELKDDKLWHVTVKGDKFSDELVSNVIKQVVKLKS